MKNEPNKKHHFIPQCYLSYFSENGKYLNIYSKIHKRNSPIQAISNTAYEDYFYRIPEKYLTKLSNDIFYPNFFEKDFFDKNIENLLGTLLKSISEKAEKWNDNENANLILKESEKELFAYLIVIQYLRLPNIREKYWAFKKESSKARFDIIKSILISQYPDDSESIKSSELDFDVQYKPIEHASIFTNENLINNLQSLILDKTWVFYNNKKDDFYTSDNPIIIISNLKDQPSFYDGFGMKGVEIIFPLSSSVLLTLWDKSYFTDKLDFDNKFLLIDDKIKRKYNSYQYCYSNSEVYSKKNDFGLIKALKQLNNDEEVIIKKSKILINGK